MKESVIKWQTGLPDRSCFCIVTLCTGIVVGHVRFDVNNDYDRDYFKKYVKAWCSEMDVEPYKED